jgi:adenylate kinase
MRFAPAAAAHASAHASVNGSVGTAVAADKSGESLVILGPPGGGKGTISKMLLKTIPNLHHISTGDLLRAEVKSGSKLGREIDAIISKGGLVEDEIALEMVRRHMSRVSSGGGGGNKGDGNSGGDNSSHGAASFLFDGFPRKASQAWKLDEIANEVGSPVAAAIQLDVPTEEIVRRVSNRWIHEKSGRV